MTRRADALRIVERIVEEQTDCGYQVAGSTADILEALADWLLV